MAEQVINQAHLFTNDGGGDVNLTIHGNVNIMAGGDVLPPITQAAAAAAIAAQVGNVVERGQEANFDARSIDKGDDKYLPQGARPKRRELDEAFDPTRSIESQKMSKKHAELCDVVNKRTIETTKVTVVEDFEKGTLNEPEFKVYPQMRRVENFFRGGYETYEDIEIEVSKNGQSEKKIVKNQLRREMGFHYQEHSKEDETIDVNQLVASVTQKKALSPDDTTPVTAIVASAGSGKTTLLRRIARKCAEGCSDSRQHNSTLKETKAHFKMVRFIEMKNMRREEKTDLSAMLFGGLYESEEDEKKAYKWLIDHQSEAILFFDGLDQATWSVPPSNARRIEYFQKSNTAEIMFNLLSRNLLPHVKIVIASREFKVSELPAKARPEEIISLVGLTRNDAERLFVCLTGKGGEEMWGKIEKMARRLVNLVSIPVFLVLTAAVVALDPDKPPPITITDLYTRVLLNLCRVENILERVQILKVIGKLKAMAHKGMMEGRVIFNAEDLKEFDLSMKDVRDLMIKVPGNVVLSQYLFEGDFSLFFCHQSLQEFLSASNIAEMELGKFSEINNQLHERRWSVVRTFLSGIIHEKTPSTLHKVTDGKSKRDDFDRAIRSKMSEDSSGGGDMELLAAIYESNNDDLIKSLPRLPDVAYNTLGPDEAHMFSSIWARTEKEKEEEVNFIGCGLNDELLDIMAQNLKDHEIRVGDLVLLRNSFTAKGLNSLLTHLETDRVEIEYKRLIDFRHNDLDWNNIRRIDWSIVLREVEIINEKETITIEGPWVNGSFDKTPQVSDTDERLSLRITGCLNEMFSLLTFFQQTSLQLECKDQIYAEPDDLSKMKDLKVEGKMSEMLLDCRSKSNVDSSLFELCVRTFQVSFFDIVVDDETSFVRSTFLAEIESRFDIDVKVHWWFLVNDSDDVKKLIPIVQKNQVENLRLRILSDISFDDIKTVIENCKVKKLTMVYLNEEEKSTMKYQKAVELAAQHSIEVEGLLWWDETGAWWIFDNKSCA